VSDREARIDECGEHTAAKGAEYREFRDGEESHDHIERAVGEASRADLMRSYK
jgi:hypothetical protein